MAQTALILASSSPRRRELLALIAREFRVIPSTVDETRIAAETPAQLAGALSAAKCREVSARFPQDTVLGCDTVVDVDGEVFGKPKDAADARRMLSILSGRRHLVHTGVCVRANGRELRAVETTAVFFLGDSCAAAGSVHSNARTIR